MPEDFDTPETRWGRMERKMDSMARDLNTALGKLEALSATSVPGIQRDVEDIKKTYATRESVAPLRVVVYGIVGLTCTAVLLTLLGVIHLGDTLIK